MGRTEEQDDPTTGTVDWFDAERGVGAVRPDDGSPPCSVRADAVRACGLESLSAGDRLRFRVRDEAGERTATDLSMLRAIQRWESEGGAPAPEPPGAA